MLFQTFLLSLHCLYTNYNNMKIHSARIEHATDIARLIMMAMTDECCLYYAGKEHTLDDFLDTMVRLVKMENSQYSYRNALVAVDDDDKVIGISVSYDGASLHLLRKAFIDAAKSNFDRDFSNIEDETQAGELYLDSLAVLPEYRHQGIASELLKATVDKAKALRLPAVGLLVDKGNPNAERLYRSVGFEYVNDNTWGGHPMKHLQYKITDL